MNKKGQFIAMFGLLFVLGLVGVYFYLSVNTAEIVRMYHKSADVLDFDIQAKEYEFNLNQEVRFSSFKAFKDLSKKSNFIDKYEENFLINNFKKYFVEYFLEEGFDVKVEIIDDKFQIFVKHKDGIVYEKSGVKLNFKPEFSYILDYDLKIFDELYANCKNVLNCEDLENKNCKVLKNKCSSKDNYINMEYDLEDNGFIKPVIKFKISGTEKL